MKLSFILRNSKVIFGISLIFLIFSIIISVAREYAPDNIIEYVDQSSLQKIEERVEQAKSYSFRENTPKSELNDLKCRFNVLKKLTETELDFCFYDTENSPLRKRISYFPNETAKLKSIIDSDLAKIEHAEFIDKVDSKKENCKNTINSAKQIIEEYGRYKVNKDLIAELDSRIKNGIPDSYYRVNLNEYDEIVHNVNILTNKIKQNTNAYLEKQRAYRTSLTTSTKQAEKASQNKNSIWKPVYRRDIDSLIADPNGAMTEWKENFFVAHSWSRNGKMIASMPRYVFIKERTYQFISYRVVLPKDQFWELHESYVYQNNGVGFQTCLSDGTGRIYVTHYEPVD